MNMAIHMVIGDLLDKPTILNFVYYRCPGICSPLMDGLADAMDGNDLMLGEDYQALTISFDAREGTFLAVKKKNNYLNLMEKKEEAEKGWLFFTSDSASIARAYRSSRIPLQAYRERFYSFGHSDHPRSQRQDYPLHEWHIFPSLRIENVAA